MTTVTKKSICAACAGAKLSVRASMTGQLACGACQGRGYILREEEVQLQVESSVTPISDDPLVDIDTREFDIKPDPVVPKKRGRPKKVDS